MRGRPELAKGLPSPPHLNVEAIKRDYLTLFQMRLIPTLSSRERADPRAHTSGARPISHGIDGESWVADVVMRVTNASARSERRLRGSCCTVSFAYTPKGLRLKLLFERANLRLLPT